MRFYEIFYKAVKNFALRAQIWILNANISIK